METSAPDGRLARHNIDKRQYNNCDCEVQGNG